MKSKPWAKQTLLTITALTCASFSYARERSITLEQPWLEMGEISGDIGQLEHPENNIDFNITQQEGLRICFYELEVDVRNCGYAFRNNVTGYNECIAMASQAYSGCLSWVQKLPVAEAQN